MKYVRSQCLPVSLSSLRGTQRIYIAWVAVSAVTETFLKLKEESQQALSCSMYCVLVSSCVREHEELQ